MRSVVEDDPPSPAFLPAAGAAHGGDFLVEVAPALKVLLDGTVAGPGVDLHRVTALLNAVSVGVIVACGDKIRFQKANLETYCDLVENLNFQEATVQSPAKRLVLGCVNSLPLPEAARARDHAT